MPTPFVVDAADEAVRSESILNERKAADIIEETALEVDIRAWRAEGLRLLQAASAREDHVPNGARRPCSVLGDASAQAAIEDAVTRMSRTEVWFFLGALYFYKLDLIVDQPEYPTVLYWSFVTLSTLGLGDYTPKTSRVLSIVSFYVYVVGCVEIKILLRVRAESSRRPPRHRCDACSMAWRCRFPTARPSQYGRAIAET